MRDFAESPVVIVREQARFAKRVSKSGFSRPTSSRVRVAKKKRRMNGRPVRKSEEHSPVLSRVYEKYECDARWTGADGSGRFLGYNTPRARLHSHSFNNKEKRSTTNKEELKHASAEPAAGGLLKQAINKREAKQYREAVQRTRMPR